MAGIPRVTCDLRVSQCQTRKLQLGLGGRLKGKPCLEVAVQTWEVMREGFMKARIPQTSVATSSRKGWGLTEDRVQEAPPVSPSRPAPGWILNIALFQVPVREEEQFALCRIVQKLPRPGLLMSSCNLHD